MQTKEEKLAAVTTWRKAHPEKCRAHSQKYEAKNRLAINARARALGEACKIEAYRIKAESGCVKCGFSDPRALDFHHLDPSTKVRRAACGFAGVYSSLNSVWDEAKKCEVLCANCHRIHHAEERECKV